MPKLVHAWRPFEKGQKNGQKSTGCRWILVDVSGTSRQRKLMKKGAEAPFSCTPWTSLDFHGIQFLERVMGTAPVS